MSSYAAILTALDGGPETEVTLAAALAMGREFEAYVEVLQVSVDPQTTAPMVANGMTGSMVDQLISSLEEDVKARESRAAEAWRNQVTERGLPSVDPDADPAGGFTVAWRHLVGREHEEVARRGRLFDLLVLARRSVDDANAVSPTLETALMDSARPILIAPPAMPERIGRRVAIGWNGSAPAARAIGAALPLLGRAEQIVVYTVGEPGVGADPQDVVRFLARHRLRSSARLLPPGQEETGAQLLEEAGGDDADLFVAGGYGHSRFREFILGGATNTMLRSAGMPVLVAH
jgi:nucleotide-binding universal stress UspA family protein